MTASDILEIRFYNTKVGIAQCNFHATGSVEIIECNGTWREHDAAWLQEFYPQIVADIARDPVDGFVLTA